MKKIISLGVLFTSMIPSAYYAMDTNKRSDESINKALAILRKQKPVNDRVICPECHESLKFYVRNSDNPNAKPTFSTGNATGHLSSSRCQLKSQSQAEALTYFTTALNISLNEAEYAAIDKLTSLKSATDYNINEPQAFIKKRKKKSISTRKKTKIKHTKIYCNEDSNSDYSSEQDKPFQSDILIQCQLCMSKCPSRLIQQHYEKHFKSENR